jgi:glycosyltransferase involved in cell wall biosynthesis
VKLLYVLEHYWPHVGGMETLFKTLCDLMARRGHDVTVITWRTAPTAPALETVDGVRIIRISAFAGRYGFPIAGLPATIRAAKNADVIHAATFGAAPLAWVASRLTHRSQRPPVILTVPEIWIGRWRVYSEYGTLKSAVHDFLERLIFLLPYDGYVGISRSTTSRLREVLRRRAQHIKTIYCGFDPTAWSSDRERTVFRKTFGIASDAFLIIAWGRPGTSKGFGYLVDAFPAIHAAVPNARLLLILSDAPEYRHARRELKRRAAAGVLIVDSLPSAALVDIVHDADCAVVPSLAEGFGYTTLEAVAAGIPVAASDSTSIPEVIAGQHRLFRPGDTEALSAAVIGIAKGDYTTAAVRSFPWKETVDAYDATYREMAVRGKKKKLLT